MQFLQSLFCWQGFDTRSRFFTINSALYISFIILSNLFFSISLIFLILMVVISTATTRRRLHDSELSKNWQLAPSITFLLVGIFILLTDHHSAYWLLLLPFILSCLLLTYRSKTQKNYIWGYFGPVDLSEYVSSNNSTRSQRIEPTLSTNGATEERGNASFYEQSMANNTLGVSTSDATINENSQDIGETIRHALLQNKKAVIAILAGLAIIICAVFITTAISSFSKSEQQETAPINNSTTVTRLHSLQMPDNFTLMMSENDGVIINWQADEVDNSTLWSQQTAIGDDSCSVISFNNGDKLRTLTVTVEANAEYYANFSPLDSSKIINSLALRGSFSLCGYKFSLKGSQSTLGKHSKYADMVNY